MEIEFKQRVDAEQDISPGFQVATTSMVAYIFYASKMLLFTWLRPVSIGLIVAGFMILIIETLKKSEFIESNKVILRGFTNQNLSRRDFLKVASVTYA